MFAHHTLVPILHSMQASTLLWQRSELRIFHPVTFRTCWKSKTTERTVLFQGKGLFSSSQQSTRKIARTERKREKETYEVTLWRWFVGLFVNPPPLSETCFLGTCLILSNFCLWNKKKFTPIFFTCAFPEFLHFVERATRSTFNILVKFFPPHTTVVGEARRDTVITTKHSGPSHTGSNTRRVTRRNGSGPLTCVLLTVLICFASRVASGVDRPLVFWVAQLKVTSNIQSFKATMVPEILSKTIFLSWKTFVRDK